MSWLFAALIAAFINGTSAIFDKKLLGKQGLADPVAYTFWVGILGLLVLVVIPFGFVALPLKTILIALLGGVIFIFALFTFFTALYKYSALGFLQMVGGFTPVLTLFVTSVFFQNTIGLGNTLGLIILVCGTFVFLRTEEHGARYGVFSLAVLSSIFFSASDILKKIALDFVPKENIYRSKQGFGVPIGQWFRGELKDYLCDNLLSSDFLGRGYFKPVAVKEMVNLHLSKQKDYSFQLWTLLMFELWHKKFMEDK